MTPTIKAKADIARFRAATAHLTSRFHAKAKDTVGELYIYDAIGGGFFGGVGAQDVAKALADIKSQGATSLTIYINSPGGDVFDGAAIYNQIKRFDGKKTVVIDGLAASAASLIAMAGDSIVMAPSSMMMIHDPWGMCVGSAPEMRKTAETLDAVAGTLIDTYVARTKNSAEDVKQWMADETWMTADEAKSKGFCDEILSDDDGDEAQAKAAVAHPLLAKFDKTPEPMREAARSGKNLIDAMNRRTNQSGRASPTVTQRTGQPGRE